MEGKGLGALVVMFMVVLGMVVEQTYAASTNFPRFPKCYLKCFILCNIPFPTIAKCAFLCLAKCIIRGTSPTTLDTHHHYCNLGCASSKCSAISTLHTPREEEVGNCVNSCSDICHRPSTLIGA
ncbi:hypothetical protein IFM89_011736 [Coptis chinensis]|uniref:Thionin-like protein 2 n=1 Tax=Coptis chinensis TaxID=261450 RepID=A0A835MCG8_9MAGN|nr:hypothetical protein IFM89_011736 [Coptis chinensis]